MILAAVRFGDFSPSLAEQWVTNIGLEPFPPFPNIEAFDPMQEQEWTLPMAAAHFIWRSTDAVRDQWMRYRHAWLDNADPSNQMPLTDVSLGELFASADLNRFQISPYRAYVSSAKIRLPKSNLHRDRKADALWRTSPLSRLQTAIESQKINLTGVYLRDRLRQPIKPPHLKDQIEYLMRSGGRYLLGPLYFAPEKTATPAFSELRVYRDEVLAADEVASQADFDDPHWTLEHVLGWIAYRNPRRFRLIAPFDPSPLSEWSMPYTLDFLDQDPDGSLRVSLLQGQLEVELDRRFSPKGFPNPIPRDWWLNRAMIDVPRIWFRRNQVLSLWPPRPVPRIHSSPIVTAATDAQQTPKLKAYSELPRMQEAIINIARDLWTDRKNIPPRIGERDDQIRAEYKKRELSKAPPSNRTIKRAFKATENDDEWEPWTRPGSIFS
jgi:hypothetical protein